MPPFLCKIKLARHPVWSCSPVIVHRLKAQESGLPSIAECDLQSSLLLTCDQSLRRRKVNAIAKFLWPKIMSNRSGQFRVKVDDRIAQIIKPNDIRGHGKDVYRVLQSIRGNVRQLSTGTLRLRRCGKLAWRLWCRHCQWSGFAH